MIREPSPRMPASSINTQRESPGSQFGNSSRLVPVGECGNVAAQNCQARLIVEIALAEARASLGSATDVVIRRGTATPDPFARHHLFAAAREVAAISGGFEAGLLGADPGLPCFASTLTYEISRLESLYA